MAMKTIVIGDDTDILDLLRHYCEFDSFPLIYQTSNRRWDKHHLIEKVYDINESVACNIKQKECGSLNKVRFKIFIERICGNSAVRPEHLPPTEASTKQHFLRVFHQVQKWLGRSLNPLDYGWRLDMKKLVPLFATQPRASPVRCGCKEDGCTNYQCSCKKHGVRCSLSCVKCYGVTCGNHQLPQFGDNTERL